MGARCMVADISATGAMIIAKAAQEVPGCFVSVVDIAGIADIA